jgi:hypothetical protein
MDQAAVQERAAVFLNPVSRQQIHVAAGGGFIRGKRTEQLQAAEHELSGQT